MTKTPQLLSIGLTDIGLGRTNNEDVWTALSDIGFFALADGMGGHRAGEVAAREAIDFVCESAKKIKSRDCMELMIEMRHAIEKANRKIYQMGKNDRHLHGMGTTLCCLFWTEEVIVYAHVGDSRIYRLRDKKLELLTQDHSLFARYMASQKPSTTPFPYKNVITRSIGGAGKANPEIAIAAHRIGDLYLLCTDGLTDVLSLKEMENILNHTSNFSIASGRLIEAAKIKGSCDNMTLLMIQSISEDEENLPRS